MTRNKFVVILLVLALAGLAACSSTPGGAAPTPGGANTAGSASQQITVKGSEFKFDPNTITLKANQPVQLVFQNIGTTAHNLDLSAMPATNVQVDLSQAGSISATASTRAQQDAQAGKVFLDAAPGKQATATFTPTTAGSYSFNCTIPGHKEAGMVGTVTVQ